MPHYQKATLSVCVFCRVEGDRESEAGNLLIAKTNFWNMLIAGWWPGGNHMVGGCRFGFSGFSGKG
jgi:hypothetical protein